MIDAGEHVAHLGHDRGNATICAVDVQPDRFAPADLGNRRHRIDARRARRADGRNARQRQVAARVVVGDRRGECIGAHAEFGVDVDVHDVIETEA